MDTTGFCKGIDVNHWDGQIDFQTAMTQGGIRFFYVKATEIGVDPMFRADWNQLGAVGETRGAYDFFHGELDPEGQAELLVQTCPLLPSDMPYALDLERGGIEKFTGTRAQFVSRAHRCLDRLQQATDKTLLVYCSPGFADEWLDDSFGGYHLWVAHYGVPAPRIPAGWSDWLIWQYGAGEDGTHRVPGCPGSVDVNWFHGGHDLLVSKFGLLRSASGQGG